MKTQALYRQSPIALLFQLAILEALNKNATIPHHCRRLQRTAYFVHVESTAVRFDCDCLAFKMKLRVTNGVT